MTKHTEQKAALVFSKQETCLGATERVQMAFPIPRRTSRWFRHYALDQASPWPN
jgi:hypothetical protein